MFDSLRVRPAMFAQVLLAMIVAITLAGARSQPISADEAVSDPPETVPMGQPGSLYEYELTVVNVATNPFKLLDAYSPGLRLNSNQSIIMIQIEAIYTGDSVGTPKDDFWYEITDRNGYDHLHGTSSCEAWPLPPGVVHLKPGETARFNLCFLVPTPPVATDELKLVAGTKLITEQWPVPFSLDAAVAGDAEGCACALPTPAPLPPQPPPCGCLPPGAEDKA